MKKGTGGFFRPEKIIKEFDLKKGMKIADFGCGAGYFAVIMAKIVEEKGRVYALDVLSTSLESVRSKAKDEGLLNIETIRANLENLEGSTLKDESVDRVLMANILFQSSKKLEIIKEAKRITKKGEEIVIIEWQESQIVGPPKKLIVDKNMIKKIAKEQGLKFKKEFPAGSHHWGMIFIK